MDSFDRWMEITVTQICKEHNITLNNWQDWQRNKFFIFEEFCKRHEAEMEKYLKRLQETQGADYKGGI